MESFESRMAELDRQVWWVRAAALALFAAGAGVALWSLPKFSDSTADLEALGSFLAGGAGALWSVAGLALIYLAFLGQQQQVLQQAEELAQTREEMREQTATFEAQRFDNSFFSLLDSHENFVRELFSPNLGREVQGRAVFRHLRDGMANRFENVASSKQKQDLQVGVSVYDEWYSAHESMLGPYFRSLYQIVKFVDDRKTSDGQRDERKRYLNFVRARLSSDELVVLFYNLASERGAKFRPLARRYLLLKHLPAERLLRPAHLNENSATALASDDAA